MSQPTVSSPQPPQQAQGAGPSPAVRTAPGGGGGSWFSGQTIRGVPNWALISVVALLAIGGVMWYRSRQSAKTATTAQQQQAAGTGTTTSSTAGQCYDSSGNVVDCTQADYASQLATLQSEIDNLQGQTSTAATSGGQATVPTATTQAVQPAVGSTSSSGTSTPVTSSSSAGGSAG